MRRLLALCALLAPVGCEADPDPYAAADAAVPRRRPAPPRNRWTTGLVQPDNVGRQPELARAPDGTLGLAYFEVDGMPGDACDADGGDAVRYGLRYAELLPGTDTWVTQAVASSLTLGQPVGVDVAFEADGTPVLATLTGEALRPPAVISAYCGGHDAGLYRRAPAGWALETVVQSSDEAATGDAASDFGEVVGQWPGLALGPDGAGFLAYKDVHAGSIQRDDRIRADLELAERGDGGWRALPVDWGKGAGDFNAVAIAPDGRPLIAYHNDVEDSAERGLWVAHVAADGAVTRARLYEGAATDGPSVAVHPQTGEVLVAWYDANEGRPYLGRLAELGRLADADAWALEAIGDPRFDEGYHPRVAVDPQQGYVGVAYYRCVEARLGLGDCEPQADAVVFAWFIEGEWEREVVASGGSGLCGMDPGLAFDADGLPVVTYACSRAVGDGFELRMEWARREVLR
ncbi:MAG: hypothetical protein KC613_05435 [Myxococcales bacterium]|nr:hypothetical protein [Myxococcales bacterium]